MLFLSPSAFHIKDMMGVLCIAPVEETGLSEAGSLNTDWDWSDHSWQGQYSLQRYSERSGPCFQDCERLPLLGEKIQGLLQFAVKEQEEILMVSGKLNDFAEKVV